MILERVICGFQSGADQGCIRAAKACGLPTGGWISFGFLTEEGPRAEFADLYGAVEMPTADYAERTRANAGDSGGTIWFGDASSPGGRTTLRACHDLGLPVFVVIDGLTRPSDVAAWIEGEEVRVLNGAGNRESKSPGIGDRVERFMLAVFRKLWEG